MRTLAQLFQRAFGGMAGLEGLFVCLGSAAMVVRAGHRCSHVAASSCLESEGNRSHFRGVVWAAMFFDEQLETGCGTDNFGVGGTNRGHIDKGPIFGGASLALVWRRASWWLGRSAVCR